MPSPKWKSLLQKNSNNDSKNEGVSRRTEDPQQEIQIKDVNSFIKRKKNIVTLSYYKTQLQGQFFSETISKKM